MMRIISLFMLVSCIVSCRERFIEHTVEAPFKMGPVKEFIYPEKDFLITDYGAVPGGLQVNTEAIASAVEACSKAGGGRVVVPAGEWLTGPIHFMDNVNLHLSEGSVLVFTDDPAAYLPVVQTSWEGMECMNYSPLVYAFECRNVAITGKGTLSPKMDHWKTWFARPEAHMEMSKQLYTWAATDVPVEERNVTENEGNMRPHLIQFNRCENVLLENFHITASPFWTIHLLMCDNCIARYLDVYAHGHNNDGIDIEMTSNVLLHDCRFNQGDDAIVIKAGRNRDAWRLNKPSENIVIRDCKVVHGHTLLGIGSEMSAGVRNVYMENCAVESNVYRMMFMKTNHRRGGFIHDIYMKNCSCKSASRMFEIDTDVIYQWSVVPTYETRITDIHDIHMENCSMESVEVVYQIKGDERKPVHDIYFKNLNVGRVTGFRSNVVNAFDVFEENIVCDEIPAEQ